MGTIGTLLEKRKVTVIERQRRHTMTRLLLAGIMITLLSGCSELQVIGRAAVKEVQAEAINVEWARYNQDEELAALKNKTLVAQAELRSFAGVKRQIMARRGKWEAK